jgi:pullulanase
MVSADWYFRGTPNQWAADELSNNGNGTYSICQQFNSGDANGSPRFKIDRFGNWQESYPSIDKPAPTNSLVNITFTEQDQSIQMETVTTCDTGGFTKVFNSLNFRGTPTGWQNNAMTLISNNTWQTDITFDGQVNQRFKFDVAGDWSENYGDTNTDGVLDLVGSDIATSITGDYRVTVNDITKTYSVEPIITSGLVVEKLGAEYDTAGTTFSIWSPENSDVVLNLNGVIHAMPKAPNQNGYSDIYGIRIEGDLHEQPYYFEVGGIRVRDPYGKMAMHDEDTNIVMDMSRTQPTEGWAPIPTLVEREDAIIYEVHIRDFTIHSSSGVSAAQKGKYLGMVEPNTTYQGVKTGIDHLKELGVTHVQLLPFYDFASCPDINDTTCYNWGYDPRNYNVPEERYATTEDYEERVRELKTMINEFHKAGIRVIMDVVYNHTADKEMFEPITDQYYTDFDLSGCCGNAVDANVPMVGRMIQDSLEYWIEEYNLDGFRFDLVGIFDHDEFGQWGRHLNTQFSDRNLLVYGEPWAGDDSGDSRIEERVRLGTIAFEDDAHVGVFNDQFRNALKGGNDNGFGGGFIFNQDNKIWNIDVGSRGSIRFANNPDATIGRWDPMFAADPVQSINYVSAHDNLTLHDKIVEWASLNNASNNLSYLKRLQNYANGIILTSQGMPFIHAGAELLRTKGGVHNSYNYPDSVNKIDWQWKVDNADTFAYYKDLISLRKAHSGFRMNTWDEINQNVTTNQFAFDVLVNDINASANNDTWNRILVIYASGGNFNYPLPSGNWKVAIEKNNPGLGNGRTVSGSVAIEGTAVTVLYQD